MASVDNHTVQASCLLYREESRRSPRADLSLWQHILFSLVLAMPFIGLSSLASELGFLSNQHAHQIAKVLQAVEAGRLELIGFTYPPLPFLLTALWIHPLTPSVIASLAAGATAWLLLHHLYHTTLSTLTKIVLLSALAFTPASMYLATQSMTDMVTLLLFLLAWLAFLRFTREGVTLSGFISGLVLGIAFYFNSYALFFSLVYALASPFFYRWRQTSHLERKWQADLTLAIVIGFPTALALLSWAYLNWLFTKNAWQFLTDPSGPYSRFFNPSAFVSSNFIAILSYCVNEVLRAPIYLIGAALLAAYAPKRLIAYFAPFITTVFVRMIGWNYSEAMAIGTYSVVAVAAIPRHTTRGWDKVLLLMAVFHWLLNLNLQYQSNELKVWQRVMLSQEVQTVDAREIQVAQWLCQQPPQSILADDRAVYRLIARCSNAKPFLLPAEGEFLMALHSPAQFVSYILVRQDGEGYRDQVSQRYNESPPLGFEIRAVWGEWVVYQRKTTTQ